VANDREASLREPNTEPPTGRVVKKEAQKKRGGEGRIDAKDWVKLRRLSLKNQRTERKVI